LTSEDYLADIFYACILCGRIYDLCLLKLFWCFTIESCLDEGWYNCKTSLFIWFSFMLQSSCVDAGEFCIEAFRVSQKLSPSIFALLFTVFEKFILFEKATGNFSSPRRCHPDFSL
jgi:hypothetical protein